MTDLHGLAKQIRAEAIELGLVISHIDYITEYERDRMSLDDSEPEADDA